MPHAGHLCVSDYCRFRLNTYVNGYIVSTVGEYIEFLKRLSLTTEASFTSLGCDEDLNPTYYETKVFKAIKGNSQCCPYEADIEKEVLTKRYKTFKQAFNGHITLVEKTRIKGPE